MTRIVGSRVAYKGYVTITIATLSGEDGVTHEREIEDHGRAVCVLPYDPARRVALLVRMPRAPVLFSGVDEYLFEAPAGMVDEGESPEVAVRREAMEEAGLELRRLETVATAWPSPGVSAERTSLFLAAYGEADRVGIGGGLAGEHEAISVAELTLAELADMADDGRLTDLKTLVLVQTLRVRRPELFVEADESTELGR